MNKNINLDNTSLPTEHSNSELIYEYTKSYLKYYEQGLDDDWFYEEKDRILLFIARQWLEACEQLDKEYDWKAKKLQNCYSCIGLAAILFAINVILNTICP